MNKVFMNEKQASERFHKGQTVWVRGLQEILETLDAEGKLSGLPFIPEMVQYCGHSFQISCIPNMACVEGVGFSHLPDVVFLQNLRCDGGSHDGCQRDCLLFWKEDWLSDQPVTQSNLSVGDTAGPGMTELKTKEGERYFCQSTELAGAVSEYRPDESPQQKKFKLLMKFIRDVCCGEMTLAAFIARLFNAVLVRVKGLLGIDTSGRLVGRGNKTETLSLGLQPGEWVEVKTRKEIAETLDINGKNRGLVFDTPMGECCGQRFQVETQLEKIILEETGQMLTLKNTVLLQDNICTAWGCPRGNRPFWREIWLKRIEPKADT